MGRLAEDGLSNMWNSCLLFYKKLFAFEMAKLCDTQQAYKPVKAHAIRQCRTSAAVCLANTRWSANHPWHSTCV